jgi:transcriptional regulator with XRE-family HTH domain
MPRSEPDPILSATVRALREKRGLTREALAFHVGVSNTTLAQIELGNAGTCWSNVRRIARALDLSIVAFSAAVEATEQGAAHAA